MPVFSIREFKFPEDYDQAVEIWKNSGPGVNFSRSDTPAEIQKKLNYSPDLFLVAVANEKIVGTVIGAYDGRRGIIYHLAIETHYRKSGIGKALMQEVESRLKGKGCVKSYLMINKDNLSVVEYYQDLGWKKMDVTIMGKEFE
jgi:ribosomal protein S18 acetylase RimI-like enzyme